MGSQNSRIDLEKNTSSESKKLTITIIVLFLILAAVYLGIIFGVIDKDKVDYNDCNHPQGEFAVEPGIVYNSTVAGCPGSGRADNKCIFGAGNLTAAINICNENSEKCNRFSYDTVNHTIYFAPMGSSSNSDPTYNSYTRQTNITYKTKGASVPIAYS